MDSDKSIEDVCLCVHALAAVAEQISSSPISDTVYKPVLDEDENEIMSQQPCGELSRWSGTSSNQIISPFIGCAVGST